MTEINFDALQAPFPAEDVRWKPQSANADTGRALAVAYITARAIQDRLDAVAGAPNWQVSYQPGPSGGVTCKLSIRCGDEWITKEDGAENTAIEAIKGGYSDAMRRAGVVWGIGRYLYNVPSMWVEAEFGNNKKFRKFRRQPALPAWALPHGTPDDKRTPPRDDVDEDGVLDDAPAQQPPRQQRPPQQQAARPTEGTSSWKLLTDYMQASRLRRADVEPVMGGFTPDVLDAYMASHDITDPIVIIDGILNGSRRQADMVGA